jgi:hypothetical protein
MMRSTILSLLIAAAAEASQGTLEVEVAKGDGTTCSADVEVRKAGGAAVLKTFVALTGGGVAQLDAGDYDVTAVCKVGGDSGGARVTVRAGSIAHYRVSAKAAVAPQPDLGTGKMHVVAGATGTVSAGHVRVLKDGKEIGRAKVGGAKFAIYDLKPGDYTLQLYDSAGKKRAEKKVTIKPVSVTLSP